MNVKENESDTHTIHCEKNAHNGGTKKKRRSHHAKNYLRFTKIIESALRPMYGHVKSQKQKFELPFLIFRENKK